MKEFKELLSSHMPGLMRYAVALVGNYEHAEKLVQSCIEMALSKNHFWDSEKKFKPWLHTIFHHIFADQNKRNISVPDVVTNLNDHLSKSNTLDTDEFHGLVRCVSQLPDEEREVLLLVTLEDLGYKQICEVIGGPIGTVMIRLHRARKNLRDLLNVESKAQTEPAL